MNKKGKQKMNLRKQIFAGTMALGLCLFVSGIAANSVEIPKTTTNSNYSQAKINYSAMSQADMQALVTKIGNKILKANSVNDKINFVLVDKNDANAYTDASNTVVVYTGLIKYCENEDELAFVIGHEIGHAVSNHIIKGAVRNTVVGVGTAVAKDRAASAINKSGFGTKFASYTGISAANVAANGIDYTAAAGVSKMDRSQENDADSIGLDFLSKADYNPLAGISIMYKIGANYSDFWSDHPSTDRRIVSMYKYVNNKYPNYTQTGFNTSAYKEAVSKYVK